MCDDCREIAASHIMDYVNLGLQLPVAIRLERDAVVQRTIMDNAGADAHEMAVAVSEDINEAGEYLTFLADMLPKTWAVLLEQRKVEFAQEREEQGS